MIIYPSENENNPHKPTANALRQREWRKNHLEQRRQLNREWDRKRGELYSSGRKPKAVKIEYADAALPDWLSKSEYERNKNAFQPGDRIWIDGHEITQQPSLFEI